MSPFVRTGQRGRWPPVTRTVEVSTRRGAVDSVIAYFSPRGQVLPVTLMTLPSSSSTFSGQPIGQTIQVYSFTSLAMPLTFFPR